MKNAAMIIVGISFCLFACTANRPTDETERPGPKRLIFGISQDPVSLDPATTTDLIYVQIAFNIFETLVRIDWDTGHLIPALATSWEMGRNGLIWKFSLRSGLTFHDGTPFNAQAVKISFERQFDPNSPYFRPGLTDINGGSALNMIKEIRALDDHTVEFTLHYPYSPFLHNLASPLLAAIVSPSALEKYGETFGEHPMGTGPFQLKQWVRGKDIALKKFGKYWGNQPAIEEIKFRIVPVLEKRIENLLLGQLDVISGLSAASANKLYHVSGIEVVKQDLLSTTFLGFHCDLPPFTDSKIRTAVAASLKVPALAAFKSHGFARPAHCPLPSQFLAHDTTLRQTDYDPKRASILKSNKFRPGELELHYFIQTDTLRDHPIAHAFKSELQRAGLQIRLVRYSDWQEFQQRVLTEGAGHLFFDGWMGYTQHSDSFLYPLFHSQSRHNFFHYRNSEVDGLLEQARRTSNENQQSLLYRRAEEIILRECPAVFISHPTVVYVIRKRIKNFKVDPLAIPWLHEVRLE